jgi:PKD repeat protein
MSITYNQALRVLEDIADAHLQVRQFGKGSPADIPEGVSYPLMWAVYDPVKLSLATKSDKVSFKILFADLLHEDKSNEAEILSDQKQTALDVVAQLQLPFYQDKFELEDDVVLEPIVESLTTDSVAGWLMNITLRVDYLSDACQVPSTLNPTEEQGCPSVGVYDSAGALLATVQAGLSYSVTDSNVRNSDSSYNVNVRAQQSLVLPSSVIYDHLGNVLHIVPATRSQAISATTGRNSAGATIGTGPAEGIITISDSRLNDIEGNQLHLIPATTNYNANIITPAFTQSAANVNAGVAINFTDQTTASHDDYLWDFGDGTYSTSQNPTKTYYAGGAYSVTLMVGSKSAGTCGILKKTNLITVNDVLLLDLFPTADFAVSFRKLRAAYAGSANRIYNGTSQQDIGFSSNEYDTASFSTFVGAGTGNVAKWYDQSGNTRDLVQATTSAMPYVILSHQNMKPGMQLDGAADHMDASGVTTPNGCTIYLVLRADDPTNANEQIYFDSVTTNQTTLFKSSSGAGHRLACAFGIQVTTSQAATANARIISVIHNGSLSEIYINGSSINTGNYGSNAFNGFRIGRSRGAVNLFFNGDYFEALIYPAVHGTSTRQAIESSLNAYWGIY